MPDPLTSERLSSIGARLEKITVPLVFAPQECAPNCRCQRHLYAGTEVRTRKVVADVYGAQYGEFFASAPDMVRDLLGEVKRLKEERRDAGAILAKVDACIAWIRSGGQDTKQPRNIEERGKQAANATFLFIANKLEQWMEEFR